MEDPDFQHYNEVTIGPLPSETIISKNELRSLYARIEELETWVGGFDMAGQGLGGSGNSWGYNPELSGEQPEGPEG